MAASPRTHTRKTFSRRGRAGVTLCATTPTGLSAMSLRSPLFVLLLATAVAPASAASFASSAGSATSGSTAGTTGSTSGDDKVVLQARDDAASFVASDGRIRGAYLEAALRALRERGGDATHASDLELARAILAL